MEILCMLKDKHGILVIQEKHEVLCFGYLLPHVLVNVIQM